MPARSHRILALAPLCACAVAGDIFCGLEHPFIQGMAKGGKRFVAVGEGVPNLGDGFIASSPDAADWTTRIHAQIPALESVAWNGSTFVAVGEKGAVFTSPDGDEWTQQQLGAEADLEEIIFAAEMFVAVGQGVWTSTDGVTWTKRGEGFWASVAWSGSLFVATGIGGILTSADGASWTKTSADWAKSTCAVGFGASTFVAVTQEGDIRTSPDGVTWETRATAQFRADIFVWCDVEFGNGNFVAVASEGTILVSVDAVTWTQVDYDEDPDDVDLRTILFDGDEVFAGGFGDLLRAKCSGGKCQKPVLDDVLIEPPFEPEAEEEEAGGGSETCAGGWMGSTASCVAVGTSDPCSCKGSTSTCIVKADFEAQTHLTLPAQCTPEGATGCFDESGKLAHPCCPGLTCTIRTRCGAPDEHFAGHCLRR